MRPFDWIWSDQHFGHFNIIHFCKRPFENLEEMHRALIDNYCERVRPGDVVLWLGDAMMGKNRHIEGALVEMKARTQACNILVKGNHDKSPTTMASLGFDLVTREMSCWIAGRPVEMSHFPYRGEEAVGGDRRFQELAPRRKAGFALLHGHTHKPIRRDGNMIHVGVDAWDYRPVSYEEIEAEVQEIFKEKR